MLTPEVIEGFVKSCLWHTFDDPSEFGDFHRELWQYCCLKDRYVAVAAPRGHSKSTSVSLGYVLANMLFRQKKFIILVSDTESQAAMFVQQLKQQLAENELIYNTFKLKKNEKGEVEFEKDTATDFIITFADGKKCRVIAKGSEQKLRGMIWENIRPDLIVIDDGENDELVMNKERREKYRRWFTGALLPCLSTKGHVRMIGTILHMDSMLERLMPREKQKGTEVTPLKMFTTGKSPTGWTSIKYRAHSDDFEHILWPSRWSKELLEQERAMRVSQGLSDVYSQEFLNIPLDDTRSHFRRADFIAMRDEDRNKNFNYYISADLAISEKERADYTVFMVGGVDEKNTLHIIHTIRARLDGQQIVDTMLQLQRKYKPMAFGVEATQISKAIGPYLREAMVQQETYINLVELSPHRSDKVTRSYSIQARMRAGAVRFDKDAEWYQTLEDELVRFPRDRHDDQVDSLSYLGLMLDTFVEGRTDKQKKEDDREEELEDFSDTFDGRSQICGY